MHVMSGRLMAAVAALLGASGCIDPSMCDCQSQEVVVTVSDAATNLAVADVEISSTPALSFACTEFSDRTQCIAQGAPYGTLNLTVSAPGYQAVDLSGEVRQPDPDALCDCGGLSLTVPLSHR